MQDAVQQHWARAVAHLDPGIGVGPQHDARLVAGCAAADAAGGGVTGAAAAGSGECRNRGRGHRPAAIGAGCTGGRRRGAATGGGRWRHGGGTACSASGARRCRYRRAGLGRQPAFARQAIPADIDADRQHHAQQDHRSRRHAALRHRPGKRQFGLLVDLCRLGLEAPRDLIGIEAQRAGVGAQEAQRIGVAGQFGDAPFLQRLQILQPDAQCRGDLRQRPADPFARRAQVRPGPRRSGGSSSSSSADDIMIRLSASLDSALMQHGAPFPRTGMPCQRPYTASVCLDSANCHFA